MRYVFIILALAGMVVSSLALHEHYREGESPCSINDKWDCGIVNKSDYAMIWKVPVAAIGIAGYFLLGILGGLRWYRLMTLASLAAVAFSLYLTYIEARILGVYCIYCVISLGLIVLTALLGVATVSVNAVRDKRAAR